MDEAEAVPAGLPMEGEAERLSFVDAVTTHQSLVFSIAYHMLHSTPLAEEIAQDVFLRLYLDYHKIESASHLVRWLRRITTHRCIDLLRQRRPQVPLDEVKDSLISNSTNQDPILAQTLQRRVAELPAVARAMVVLRYQEDLEPQEIADLLDVPVNTVKSRLHRALMVLRSKLASLEGV
jgi:RNA polymerase sigma-70 factor, ECF subfamily